MPVQKRHKTKYPGVYYIVGSARGSTKKERIYYIVYRKAGKLIEEKAGRQFQDDMTPARAAQVRTMRVCGNQLSNKERREAEKAKELAEAGRWTIDRLWQEYKSQKFDSKSLQTDNGRYCMYLETIFGNKEPKDLIQLDVDRIRIKLLKSKKPQTVKHILALLKRIVNFGVKKGICEGMPFQIEMPQVNNLKTEDLTPEQLTQLLEAIDQDTNIQAANLMKLALFTGMRRGEMFKLKWKDVDFERGFLHIRDPKGGPDQKIPLNEPAKKLLKSHEKTGSKFVFPGHGGGQRVTISKAVNRIKTRANLPKDFRPLHGLRHTYASMLASSGQVDMYTLQKLLTHKSPIMTQRYAHLRDETLRKASNLAGDIISQAVKQSDNVVDFENIKKKG